MEVAVAVGALMLLMFLIGMVFIVILDNQTLNTGNQEWVEANTRQRGTIQELHRKLDALEYVEKAYKRVCLKRLAEYTVPLRRERAKVVG